ncbi:OsmC family peroxiredoxin [Rhodococcus triatomae]|uniref:Organic hydroperoxide reductase OsmC/OhrA n=1 Tax=Rhodococcus triatomae TaxID=300028 RepID=A0A1G8K8R1_9NOCA|nr:OsmC family protein [Rhodococcus triatomae]QNG18841.1 OsmC family peroxiredoxin [Rhodococcus triatomae]QNG25247.1 OsmC family peroxiredoxin [Rhodococcus triatomae]SDI39210.1 Organic hydroperoxide reductase OsmC/OhrA [Rhodococcus triatomae]
MPTHSYSLTVSWTGNRGTGTSGAGDYDRDHVVSGTGKPDLAGSADPSFRGDPLRWNPEELLVASLSQCHMLWYLGLAAASGVVVVGYRDEPTGTMVEHTGGAGEFESVTLRPVVTVAEEVMTTRAQALHARAHEMCFIARSVNFPVTHEPSVLVS